jgi:hypothetical protein
MWSEQIETPANVVAGNPTFNNTSAAALLSYDVPHSLPWDWRVSLYTWTKGIAAGAYTVALLLVLFGVVALYIGPSIRWIQTYREAQARQGEVRALKRENRRLRERRAALNDPRTMEREARRLGLVKPGERPFIVRGLPGDK